MRSESNMLANMQAMKRLHLRLGGLCDWVHALHGKRGCVRARLLDFPSIGFLIDSRACFEMLHRTHRTPYGRGCPQWVLGLVPGQRSQLKETHIPSVSKHF